MCALLCKETLSSVCSVWDLPVHKRNHTSHQCSFILLSGMDRAGYHEPIWIEFPWLWSYFWWKQGVWNVSSSSYHRCSMEIASAHRRAHQRGESVGGTSPRYCSCSLQTPDSVLTSCGADRIQEGTIEQTTVYSLEKIKGKEGERRKWLH